MAKASITISEMDRLVRGLEDGITDMRDAKTKLSGWISTYTIDHVLGDGLQTAADWAELELPGVRRRLALAQSLEGTDPEWPTGVAEIDESAISDVPAAEAERNGAEAAEALLDSPGEIDPELAAEIEANMNDPYFAAGFAGAASPEEIAAALDLIDAVAAGNGESDSESFLALRRQLIIGTGTTLGTATRNTGELALPDGYAQQWVDAITEPAGLEHDATAPHDQAQYLALLLQQGAYSTPFLDHVGDGIYEYERSADGDPVWGPKHNHLNPVLDLDGQPVVDVMASFMVALSNNPVAAQNFFTSGPDVKVEYDGVTYDVNERLQYMTQERTWDWATDPSNGGHFGSALEAATTTYRDDSFQGRESAEIASQMFFLIGEETATNDGWKMWDGMRGNVATIMASYGPDILRIANVGSDDPGSWTVDPEDQYYGDGAPHGASLNADLMQQILNTFGEEGNEEHLDVVLTGVTAASQLRLSAALDDALNDGTPPPAPVAMLQGQNIPSINTATNEMANALGWVINGAYHGRLDEDEIKEKQAKLTSDLFGAITSLPGIGPAGTWSKFAYDQITSQIEDHLGEAPSGSAGEFGDLASNQETMLEQMIINQMLASGYWDEAYIEEANGGPDGTRYSAPDPDAIIPGDPPRFDFDHPAYQDWRRRSFPLDDFLNTHIYPPFDDALNDGLGLPGR